MKKLSISLFAVLAIVFATTSAFTTKESTTSKKFQFDYYEVTSHGQIAGLNFPMSVSNGELQSAQTNPPSTCQSGGTTVVCALLLEPGTGVFSNSIIDDQNEAAQVTIAYEDL